MAQTTQANPEDVELPAGELESQIDSLLADVESVTSASAPPEPSADVVDLTAPSPEEAEVNELEDVRASEATDRAVDEAVSAAETMDRVQEDLAREVEAQTQAPSAAPAPVTGKAPAQAGAPSDADALADAIAAQAAALANEPQAPQPAPVVAEAPAPVEPAAPVAEAPEDVEQLDQQLAAMTQNLLETEPAADPAADPVEVASAQVEQGPSAGTTPSHSPAAVAVAAVAVAASGAAAAAAVGAAGAGATAPAVHAADATGAKAAKAGQAVKGAGASLSRSLRGAWGRVEPALLRAAGKASAPLASRPTLVRDTIGYVAIVTLFWGGVVWAYALVLRPTKTEQTSTQAFDFATSGLPQPEVVDPHADPHAAASGEEGKDAKGGDGHGDSKDAKKDAGKPVLNAAEGDFVVNHAVAEREKAAKERAKSAAAGKDSKSGGGGH